MKYPSPAPVPIELPCPKRMALLREYARITEDLARCVEELRNLTASAHTNAFEQAWERCESLRSEAAAAMRKVYAHIRAHRCALGVQK